MNYTIVDNPWKNEDSLITTRGVMTDAKIAKLNNTTKRPALVANWESKIPQPVVSPVASVVSTPVVSYKEILDKIEISIVNYPLMSNNTGAKKLRVNGVVCEKTSKVNNNSEKVDVIPQKPEVVVPKVEEKPPVVNNNPLEPNVIGSREEIHGRHEHTGEIPVNTIKEAIKSEKPPVSREVPLMTSRAEKNANIMVNEQVKESKAGDMDLYNNLLHNATQEDDVSRQLQGARNQLSIEKEENKKLAEQYGEAVKELAKLKEDIEATKKQQEQQAKEELSMTLKNIESLQKENLERTSDLTSIQSEIARLKAEKRAMEESFYEDSRSYGRAA